MITDCERVRSVACLESVRVGDSFVELGNSLCHKHPYIHTKALAGKGPSGHEIIDW